jgi:hypothetical protein
MAGFAYPGAAMTAATLPTTTDQERHRRSLLAASDDLLDQVEELRLADRTETPPSLQDAIGALQRRLGGSAGEDGARTLDAAHELVLAVQERLLALSRGRDAPRRHHDRAAGSPAMAALGRGGRWKLLVLPARPDAHGLQPAWRKAVLATLERALDRWDYAHHHARRGCRGGIDAEAALERARAAWDNYWELYQEAERLGVIRPAAGPARRR